MKWVVLVLGIVYSMDLFAVNSNKELNIYLGGSSKAPYDIHAGAVLHASFNYAVLGSLIEVDHANNLQPSIIEKFSYDFKKNTYSLWLRKDIFFHNNRKAKSKDLEFTILRGFFSKERNFFSTYLAGIEGLEKINKKEKFESGKVSGVKIIDEYCIEIKLKSPNPTFLHSLAVAYFSLVPREELEEDYFTWKNNPVGTGPFKVVDKYDGMKTVVKNNHGLTLNFYTSKAEDILYDISLEKENLRGSLSQYITPRSSHTRMFEFSNEHRLSKDKKFRCIFSKLINEIDFSDKERGIAKVNELVPTYFQTNKKKTIFDECSEGYSFSELQKDEIKVAVFAGKKLSDNQVFVFDKIKTKFNEYNLRITFEINEEKFPTLETAQKYPVSTFSMIADYIDPLVMFSAYRKNGHAGYYTPIGEEAEEYEELYLKALSKSDFEEKIEKVKKLSQYASQKYIFVPFAEEKTIFYYNKNKIEDFGMPIDSLRLNFQNMRIKD